MEQKGFSLITSFYGQFINRLFLNFVKLLKCRLCLGAWSDHGERTGGFYACNRYEVAKQDGVVRKESSIPVVFCGAMLEI